MSSPKKIGLAGLSAKGSWAANSHLPYLQTSPHYQIVALQNSSTASAQAASEKYSLSSAKPYGDIEAFVNDPKIDLVVVSVKVPDHRSIAEPAIRAKKDVFVEWPLGRTLEEAEFLTKLAREKGVKTYVGLQARHDPAVRNAKKMVESGELGTILSTTMKGSGLIYTPKFAEYFLYTLPIEAGANLVTIPVGHAVDALCYVLGEFSSLSATLANNTPTHELVDGEGKKIRDVTKTAHDYLAMTGLLKKGGVASVVYQAGTSKTDKQFYWEIQGTKGTILMEGSVGGHLQMFHPSLKCAAAEGEEGLKEVEVGEVKGFETNVGSAYDAIAGKGTGSVTTFEDAVVRHRMIEAIYKSNETGSRESYKDVY